MEKLTRKRMGFTKSMPEKVLMFGEGNFLRAFAGIIIEKLNINSGFNGGITALQGTETGPCKIINEQDGLYTVIERGYEGGAPAERFTLINSLNRCINPYENYSEYLKVSENPNLSAIISNTTEFGICYAEGEGKEETVHKNYPAKLTDLLYKRYSFFKGDKSKGLAVLTCELIDRNGDKLKEIVLRYAKEWGLEKGFTVWLNECNIFANTLVDRIVSGYPKNEAEKICEKLGYSDSLLDICEPFLLWVVEADKKILDKIPLLSYGGGIILTEDMEPYRTRKVRILNGAHTMSVLAGHLFGLGNVEELVMHPLFNKYLKKGIFEEIIPSMKGENLEKYAEDVLERFKNPYLNHRLLSISLNSISKFKTRVLPSIIDYAAKNGKAPDILSFSFAALIAFYKNGIGSFVNDEKQYIDILREIFAKTDSATEIVKAVLSEAAFWGGDISKLNGIGDKAAKYLSLIETSGIKAALEDVVNGK